MKKIIKLAFLSVALTASGSILAQEGKKADPSKTETPKTQVNTPAQKGSAATPAKNKNKSTSSEAKKGESGAKNAPETPAGMAISENGVATPAKAKSAVVAPEPAATPAAPAPASTPDK